jgi:hypothetical protein
MLIVAKTKALFTSHHIDLPAGEVTPDQVRLAINEWLVKTFKREWQIMASTFPTSHFPHGAKDPFKPDPEDPFDPLHDLPPLSTPRFLPGVLCAVKSCSYLAYLHPFCAACCRRKFKVEVKRTTSQQSGLGLFATSRLEGKGILPLSEISQMHIVQEEEEIINFCTLAEYIDEEECTFSIHISHNRSCWHR